VPRELSEWQLYICTQITHNQSHLFAWELHSNMENQGRIKAITVKMHVMVISNTNGQ